LEQTWKISEQGYKRRQRRRKRREDGGRRIMKNIGMFEEKGQEGLYVTPKRRRVKDKRSRWPTV